MIVKPETFKHLVAIKNGKIVSIPNMLLRKICDRKKQDKKLTDNSVCIVCNFRFLEDPIEWSNKIKAVCHPFRSDAHFSSKIKKYLFSESDFCDKLISPIKNNDNICNQSNYDFVYFTLNSKEGTRSKGLHVLPIINEVARSLNLKGLVIDYSKRETKKHEGTIYHKALKKVRKTFPSYKNIKIIKKNYSTGEVCSIMKGVKFVLLPSDADASPRLLVESLIRGCPLVVNQSIYGGWKYINENNGAFFDAPSVKEFVSGKYNKDYKASLKEAMEKVLLIDPGGISRGFYEKYGFINSSRRFASIINNFSGTDYDAVCFKEWTNKMKQISKKIG
jgi:glycosyltransferase involved in cell wall biosynthesis